MNSSSYGWWGKILRVDLSSETITEIDTHPYADRFLGGRGIATRLYWEYVPVMAKAFDPENHLIFMTGPLTATGAQGASRFEVVGKSPMLMPEGFCYGNMGGYWGPALKRAGFDGLMVFGKANRPVYLFISDGKATLQDAAEIHFEGVKRVGEYLKQKHGKNTHFITTGPAGMNLCRNANLMTDNEGSATGGFGAVLGAKNLKAIAVIGTQSPLVSDPEALKELNHLTIKLNQRDTTFNPYPPDQISRKGKASCFQCGLDCIMRSTFKTKSNKEVVRKCQSIFVYFPWVMGRPGEPAETALDATGLCNDLSLCTMEMANIVQWISAGYEAGYLNDSQTGLEIDKLGEWEFFENLCNMIAYRQGFGDLLAEGLLRAGETLGTEAQKLFANEVAGVGDGATYSAREYLMNGLLYAFEPRQPIAMLHEISRIIGYWVMNLQYPGSTPVSADVYRAAAAKFWCHDKAWDLNTHEGKAIAASRIIDRTYVKDSLGLCDSCWPLMFSNHTEDKVGDTTLEARIFNAVTGKDLDENALHKFGEIIFNQQRAILLREGWDPKTDDTVAEFNFTDPVQSVFMNPDVLVPGEGDTILSRKGQTLDREVFKKMRDEFYQLRGWNPETGYPTAEKLFELGLSDLSNI
ncbi:aldehyde ferredoxin oxidoreductase N-terminal domain-containing protein [Desulfobacula sp.]|uniref:aldehyde ferredoxin oxidoreductase N-terminal domain-containing protein n=1 Tax=Desulfobacula sp. TaxID=2593537 RepID=UPI00263A1ED0|nr:aldehyde ferredoxin oxidoreductase N-terminal domain-containing protein [Desulfobacula sp.]